MLCCLAREFQWSRPWRSVMRTVMRRPVPKCDSASMCEKSEPWGRFPECWPGACRDGTFISHLPRIISPPRWVFSFLFSPTTCWWILSFVHFLCARSLFVKFEIGLIICVYTCMQIRHKPWIFSYNIILYYQVLTSVNIYRYPTPLLSLVRP